MNGESSAHLLKRVSGMISKVSELVEKARTQKLPQPFAEDQAQAFLSDITSGLNEITEATKRGKLPRFAALLVAAKGRKAITEIMEAEFGRQNGNPS